MTNLLSGKDLRADNEAGDHRPSVGKSGSLSQNTGKTVAVFGDAVPWNNGTQVMSRAVAFFFHPNFFAGESEEGSRRGRAGRFLLQLAGVRGMIDVGFCSFFRKQAHDPRVGAADLRRRLAALVRALRSAPWASSQCTASAWPCRAKCISRVPCVSSRASTLAPRAASHSRYGIGSALRRLVAISCAIHRISVKSGHFLKILATPWGSFRVRAGVSPHFEKVS
jgi:hypothetical protein